MAKKKRRPPPLPDGMTPKPRFVPRSAKKASMSDDPGYIRAFKDYTRADLTDADYKLSADELYGDSDRARITMLSSLTETALDAFIETKLRQDISSGDRGLLFNLSGPLSTFSSKALVAYSFGMIGPETRDDLDLIRTLRNGFAHCHKALDFETPVVVAVCNHLKAPNWRGAIIPHGYFSALVAKKQTRKINQNHPRVKFLIAGFTIYERLLDMAKQGDQAAWDLP